MSALQEVATSFTFPASGKEVIHSLAWELIIFSITIVIALIVKVFTFTKKGDSSSILSFRASRSSASKCSKDEAVDVTSSERQAPPSKTPSIVPHPPESDASAHRKVAAQGVPNIVARVMDRTSVKNGNAEEALALYNEMRSTGQLLQINELARESRRHSALDFFSALLQTAVRAGQPQLAEQLMDDMKSARVERPLAFYESAMKVLSSKKHYKEALNVYGRLTSEGLQASPVTLSCLINFTAELEDYDRAIGFFEQLASTSTPSIRAYMTALRVHSKRQDWSKSLQILRSMQERRVQIDSLIVNTILATGVSAGRPEAAEALLHEMTKTNPKSVDVISYNTVLKGYAHQKTADKALKILDRMLERGVKANGITFNTVMDAAVRCSQIEDAWRVLEQMQSEGIQPDKFTCTILMKGLHEDSTPKQLSKVLDMLQLALPQCDSSLRSTLFRGIIQIAARLSNMALVMRAFNQMQEQRVPPAATDYQTMIQALAQHGHTSDCSTVWQSALNSFGNSQIQDHTATVTGVFTAVMEELSKREKVEGMLCAFESLSEALTTSSKTKASYLLQQCRQALFQAASRKKDSNPAFKRLLELAPEYGLSLESSVGKPC